jgi:hypothetical protein
MTFFTFYKFLNSKNISSLQDQKNIELLGKDFFGFSILHLHLKYLFDIEKDKK